MPQNTTPLLDALENFIDTDPAYFRIPGHRLSRGISPRWADRAGSGIFSYDVTETPLTDDLHCPDGAIRDAQKLMAQLYGADKSFFLVNGSTCGNEAMIISAAHGGEKIMVARNAHKSAMMGLVLSGASPVYVMPGFIPEWSIQGAVSADEVERQFAKNPDCRALFLVSPSYYGICSDLAAIADICHAHGALLLVDEAHGGHMYFHESLPQGALEAGADICVQSLHKVAGALTQSSVLHIKSHGINEDALGRVAENLHLVQSTSPSYLLMASLDCARYELAVNGKKMMQDALTLADYARSGICRIPGFMCMGHADSTDKKITHVSESNDMTRLVISARGLGLSGFELDRLLFEKYAVNMELADHENVLAIVTYANSRRDIDRLVEACADIGTTYRRNIKNMRYDTSCYYTSCYYTSVCPKPTVLPETPPRPMTPRTAYFAKKQKVRWPDAVGKISGQIIAPYPPGIPAVYPGELITREVWEYIERFRKEGSHIHGADSRGHLDYVSTVTPPSRRESPMCSGRTV